MPFWRRKPKPEVPPPVPRVAGVIPCAGASTRMGRSKALLDAGGRSFVAAAVGTLVGGGCDPVIVVVGPGQDDEARRAKAAGAAVLENPDPGEGPITSLRLALGVLGSTVEGVAFLPVDHPGVRAETVAALLETFTAGDAPLLIPIFQEKRGHPAIFRRTLFPNLMDPQLQGGARTVVHAHLDAATLLAVDDAGVVTDIDTPEAYRDAFGPKANP
ncbi:MAG TPA: nucleotidyltransferase family protein [Longimicrobiales bacterium]|nr:nucleotidyltransferase family protein [Longimicrobiales bacterium]